MPLESLDSAPPAPVVDPIALARVLRRLARTGRAPWLHEEAARRMSERLRLIRQPPTSWLDWWSGLGGGAQAVAQVWPDAHRQAVEPTPEWLAIGRARRRPPWWSFGLGRPATQLVHPEGEVAEGQARMVWANMMLHACPDPAVTMARWHRALGEGGFLMFSTLGPQSLRELREIYSAQGWPAPHAPFADMHDLGDLLVRTGFAEPVMDQERITLSWSSPDALIDELRSMGGNLDPGRAAGLRTPRWRERLVHLLAERANSQGRITLQFELVYGHAYKAAPRAARSDSATVSLQSLRSKLPGARAGKGAGRQPESSVRTSAGASARASSSLRRGLVAGAAAAGLLLAACDMKGPAGESSPAFHGIDVTGAEWGRRLSLADADGRPTSLDDFRGKVVVIFFGYTQCPDVCPTTMAELAEARRSIGADGERVQGVFVTVDPERDTAEVLKAYVAGFGPGVVGLRGTPEQTREVASEFKVFYAKVPGKTATSYTVDHTAGSYLFDTQGRLRVFARHGSGAKSLADDLKLLLAASR